MMNKWLAGLLVALLHVSAGAAVTLSKFPPNPGVLPGGGWKFSTGTTFADPTPPRAWINGTYGSVPKIVATDTMLLSGRAGALTVGVAQRVGIAEAAAAVGRCMLGSVPICAAGTAAAIAYEVYRIHSKDDYPGVTAPDGLVFDPGTPPVTGTGFEACRDIPGPAPYTCRTGSTKVAAIQALLAVYPTSPTERWQTQDCTANTCDYYRDTRYSEGYPWGGYAYQDTVGASAVMVNECPASVDPFNALYNVPAGQAVGFDGKCKTARYNHVPISESQAAAKVAAYPPADPGTFFKQPLQDAIDTGGQSVPAEIEATGPASQTGTPVTTTTTSPSGTRTETVTPTYTYNYAGDTITYNTSTTTVVVDNGVTTTTTTNTTGGGASEQDPKDPCTAAPTRAGCVKLGDPPTAEELPRTTIPVALGVTTFASPGGCPSPIAVSMFSHSYAISYQPLCDALGPIRFIFLAFGAALAAIIFMEGLRS